MSHDASGRGVKKSNFTAVTSLADSDTLDVVRSRQNLKITVANFIAGLGVSGSIAQVGKTSDTPILDKQGSVNGIRNLNAGFGIGIAITPENSIKISTSFSFDTTGIKLVDDASASPAVFRSLVAGSNILITSPTAGQINIAFDESDIKPSKTVVINKPADFPAAVLGVRELTAGANVVYEIDSANMDMGTDVFTMTGGSCVIRGTNQFASTVTSLGTADLFTTSDATVNFQFVQLDGINCPYLLNYTSVTGANLLVLQNVVVLNCQSIARIDGAVVTSLRTFSTINSSVGGFDFVGTANSQLNITNFLGAGVPFGWTGTLINLGTATFDLIVISGDNRFLSPPGTVILGGAAASANINVNGRAIVSGCLFNGTGTPLTGITTQDLQWEFNSNVFADAVTKNTKSSTKGFISALTTAPTAAAGTGVFVAVGGALWTSNSLNRWTVSTAGVATFIGLDNLDFKISHHSTVAPASGGSVEMQAQIFINGAPQSETLGSTTSSLKSGVAGDGIFNISNGDTVQLFAAIIGTVDIDFSVSGIVMLEA